MNRTVYLFIIVCLVLGGDVCIAATKRMSGQGPRALIGNTIHALDIGSGQEYWEYLNPDGTGVSLSEGAKNTFTWKLNGDQLCEQQSWGEECSTYEITGKAGIETSVSGTYVGTQEPIQILPGNPKGL